MTNDLDATQITLNWHTLDIRIRAIDAADALTLAAAIQRVAKLYCGYPEARILIEGLNSEKMQVRKADKTEIL